MMTERDGLILSNRGIVYNSGHKFAKEMIKNPSLFNYNVARVVISAIIKSQNEQTDMDASTTLKYFEDILHGVYL